MRGKFALLLLLCLCAVPVQAQFKASMQGTVIDPQGNAVAAAKVTVTNQATQVSYSAVTNDQGFYRVNELPPGNYTVDVEVAGFKKSSFKDVVVEAEQPRGFDVSLQVGAMSETVTVLASGAGLQTEDANITGTISQQQIERLPQFGRDPYELVRLSPGVFGDGARLGDGRSAGFPNGAGANNGSGGPGASNQSIFATENQQPISSNGQRVTANDYTIDGVSVNSLNWGGAAVITPTQESVQEITVLSNDYAAEDGRNAGAHIKVVTKGGTNEFHGSGFFLYETPGLNAFNKFSGFNPGVGPAPTVRVDNNFRNFGGSVGGPVLKDKLFFFFAYEGLRSNNQTFSNQYVDTPQFDQSIAALEPNTPTGIILSQSGIRPRISQVLPSSCKLWPSGQCQVVNGGLDIGSPTGSYGTYVPLNSPTGGGLDGVPDVEFAQISVPSHLDDNQYNARVDYVRGHNTFSASTYLTYLNNLAADDASAARPMDDFRSKRFSPAGFLSWVSTISSAMVNEARFNFTRFGYSDLTANSNVNFGIPRIEIEGLPLPGGQRIRFGSPQSATQPGIFAQNTFAFKDAFSHLVGTHAMKYGFEYTHEQNNSDPLGGGRPQYVFHFPWNFVNGTPIFEQIAVDPATGGGTGDSRHFRASSYSGFVQDDWKFRPNLTFNIGLRYDYFTPLSDASHQLAIMMLGSGANALQNAVMANPDQMTKPSRRDFGPRLGFAWSPGSLPLTHMDFKNRLVVRGGFGIAYDRIEQVAFVNSAQNPPFYASYGLCCGTGPTDPQFGGNPGPFGGGTMLYALGANKSPLSYPANPLLAGGIDPATGLPLAGGATIYGTPQDMPTPYVYLYSLGTEYATPGNWVVWIGYQGSESRHLLRIKNLSYFFNPTGTQQKELGTGLFFFTPDTTSNYNALNTRLEHRFSRGFNFIFDYRFSKSMDELSNPGPGFTTNQTFPTNLHTEYGPSDFDATHLVRVFGLWDLPFYRTNHDWKGKLVGGWQINGIFQFHSGFPWTPVSFSNCFPLGSNFLCPVRPDSYNGKAGHDYSTDAFLPTGINGASVNFPGGGVKGGFFGVSNVPGQIPFPGVGRNSFRGPRFSDIDLSVAKVFRLPTAPVLGENAKLEFRANFFNAFNKLNLSPFTFGSASTDVNNPQFATATSGLAGRVIEFQARFSF
jgi:outer membrane receptor protein involved in Fe transport